MVPMDSTLIEQVLINLIENAFRHSGSDEPIDVIVERDQDFVAVIVRDHGKGVPEQDLPSLFDGISFRVKKNTDATRGLGLGLSICKSIITAHNGSIQAENLKDGGACFTFKLPIEED
jgi:two-component system sensor histidine kinase KdpD